MRHAKRTHWLIIALLHGVAACSNGGDPMSDAAVVEPAAEAPDQPKGAYLTLATANDYSVLIEGCASGYRLTMTKANPAINLYNGEFGCLGKLQSFTLNSVTYTPDPARVFKTYQTNDTAYFWTSDHSTEVKVTIVNQLKSPLTSDDRIDFRFGIPQAVAGISRKLLDMDLGPTAQVKRSPSNNAPNFRLVRTEIVAVEAATSRMRFAFTLDCNKPLVIPNGQQNTTCDGIRLRDLSYALVADTFNNVPCVASTYETCRTIFNQAATSTVNFNTDYVAANQPGMTNGGIVTKIGATTALASPNFVSSNPHMILMIFGDNSFQYLNVDLNVSASLFLSSVNEPGLTQP